MDYEQQAGFWEGRDSFEFTYDWLSPIGVAENPVQSRVGGMQRYVNGLRRQFSANQRHSSR
jgi:hypothetical protein